MPHSRVECSQNRKDLPADLTFVNCLVGHQFPDQVFERMPDLEWIQCLSVGVEALTTNRHIAQDIRITSARGLYGDAVAEYALWAMLTLFRKFHRVVKNQPRRKWQQVFGHSIAGKTVGIVGVGDIGGRLAQLATAMQMSTIGFVRDDKVGSVANSVDEVVPVSELSERIADVDALVLTLPLTTETTGILSQAIVSNMKSSAIVINVSRAGLIEGNAVTGAVAAGKLAGAAIDVFEREPLRRWDARWKMENLLVTPHTSAMRADFKTRVAELLRENMLRYAEGQPLLNEVDRSRGY